MNRWVKGILVSGSCAWLGAILALRLGGWFWWAGCLAGGLVGWGLCEFRNLVAAIPQAWEMACGIPWSDVGKGIAETVVFLSGLCVYFAGWGGLYGILAKWTGQGAAALLWFSLLPIGTLGGWPKLVKKEPNSWALFWLSPLGIPAGLIALFRAFAKIPKAAAFLWRFGFNLYLLVHTQDRKMVLVDSAIGAAIGYFRGSPLLGGVMGAFFWAVNAWVLAPRLVKAVAKAR